MEKNVERAKELLPAIIITVLSMIQALALELFWNRIVDSEFLWAGGLNALIGWLQLLVVFTGILLIWIMYISAALRFSWLPTLQDTLVPFFIGLLEFAMISMTGPDLLGPWFIMLAATYGVATTAMHMNMYQARRDPANDYFFRDLEPASWRDYRVSIAAVCALLLMGIVLWINDNHNVLSVAALLLALTALGQQFLQARRYWMHSIVAKSG